ncbi:rRNA-processing protein FCF1 containing PIN domain [Methanonatronarchaeum thermophilum]|uniref:rRNA-processing protein FCF1 containing PIN domain n=2 Tax=Methanonatronarchaeum thermophilum TaxID=1927129 RepID=A0A1Y3GB09_9EURY|nr:rRNA-processing protein FCF1 containing PIN domain [Methanonatronarchaeum thermophilum]
MKVILDTNILMVPEQFKVDVFREIDRILNCDYSILIPSTVIKELKEITDTGSGVDKRAAKIGLLLAKEHSIVDTEATGDNGVIEAAVSQENTVVATNDKELKERLRKKGIPLIYLRQGSHLIKDF